MSPTTIVPSLPSGGILSSPTQRNRLAGLLLLLVTVLAYLPVWRAGYIWDDATFLFDNPLIMAGDGLYRFWFTTAAPDYFPMTSSALWLEWRLWGNHPLGFHLVNVLLHAASSVLLWRILARLKIPGSWLAAAIFALHPVNVESVAWITERKNTLAMFFYAWAVFSYLRFEEGGRRRWYGFGLAAFALALLSKTAVVMLPVAMLGLAWWQRGRIGRRDVGRMIPFFILAGVMGLITVWFQYHRNIGTEIVRADSFWVRLAGAGWGVWFYLYKALWPVNLMFVYPRWNIDAAQPLSYLPGLLVVAAGVACWSYRRGWGRSALFALVYFVVMLLPVLGFLDIYFMRYSLVADHWQYFAILGPIVLVAAALTGAGKALARVNPYLGFAPGGAVLLLLGVLTWRQSLIYADLETLWRDTLAKNPACWMAHNNLGFVLRDTGRTDEAIREYQAVIRLKPDYAEAYNNLGSALADKGQVDEAIQSYQEAIRLRPDLADVYCNLGISLGKQGRIDEAIREYREAIRLNPDNPKATYNLGTILGQKGELAEAAANLQKTIAIRPDFALARHNLGCILLHQGKVDDAITQFQAALNTEPDQPMIHCEFANALIKKNKVDEAVAHYERALEIDPNYADAHRFLGVALLYYKASPDAAISHFQKALELNPASAEVNNHLGIAFDRKGRAVEARNYFQRAVEIQPHYILAENNLAWLLATSPDAALRQGDKAVELAMDADQSSNGQNPMILMTLAAAYAEARQFPAAIATVQRALNLDAAHANPDLVQTLQAQLQFYQAGTPFHIPPNP